jgi:ribonucleotide monophosphatase NagD (HAD superfamily)
MALANGQSTIEKLYFIGDNPDVDIVGANMYNHLLQQAMNFKTSISGYSLLTDSQFLSATSCESILVCTGVYDPTKQKGEEKIPWKVPTIIKSDVLEATKHIISKEGLPWLANF